MPVLSPEPDREPEQLTALEVDAVLLDRAYAQLVRHPLYASVWALHPVVRRRVPHAKKTCLRAGLVCICRCLYRHVCGFRRQEGRSVVGGPALV